jgi:hypothetical protein
MKQQSSFTVYRLPTKETNFRFQFPFAAIKQTFSVSVVLLQQTKH